MKALVVLLVLTTCLGNVSAQTIRIADNNANRPTGTNIYPSLQAAIDAAAEGDIVFVQPSTVSYGDVSINKRITLRGIGYNTGKDLPLVSITGKIYLTNKTDNTMNASGSIIEGISAYQIHLGNQTGPYGFTLQNITISNCHLYGDINGIARTTGYMNAQNITITSCHGGIWFEPTGNLTNLFVYRNFLYKIYFNGGSLSSAVISNNFIDRGNENRFGFANGLAINSLIITNNNFLGENEVATTRFMQYDLHDAIVSNNIFYGCAPLGATSGGVFERNAFINNLTFGTSNDALPPAGTGVGNTGANNKVGMDPKFVNAPFNTIALGTMDFTLQATSPAKNAGSDGTDIGITGGAYPVDKFVNVGPTQAPVIMQFNPAALVPQNQPVKTNIKAKSN